MSAVLGGLMMMVGGSMLAKAGVSQLRAGRPAIAAARERLGDSDAAVVRDLPRDLAELLARLP